MVKDKRHDRAIDALIGSCQQRSFGTTTKIQFDQMQSPVSGWFGVIVTALVTPKKLSYVKPG